MGGEMHTDTGGTGQSRTPEWAPPGARGPVRPVRGAERGEGLGDVTHPRAEGGPLRARGQRGAQVPPIIRNNPSILRSVSY